MTEREYYNKISEFHKRNMKRALTPKEEFNQKEYFEFQQEYRDFILEYYRQKQAEKQLEKELEEKVYDCAEKALDDLLKGFNGDINIKL